MATIRYRHDKYIWQERHRNHTRNIDRRCKQAIHTEKNKCKSRQKMLKIFNDKRK